jgi:hypothetical protein
LASEQVLRNLFRGIGKAMHERRERLGVRLVVVNGLPVEMKIQLGLRAVRELKEHWAQGIVLSRESLERLALETTGKVIPFGSVPSVAEVVECLI